MKRPVALVAAALVAVGGLLAQSQQQMPKPGAEQKRIGYFAGKWTTEGTMKESPFGPAGKYTGTEHSEWLQGGFFLVSHTDGKGPMGEMKGLSVLGYDREGKTYTYNAFDSMGNGESAKGTVSGDTWTWTNEGKAQGKQYKGRFTIKELPPASYSMKWEASIDGAPWQTLMEGKATKAK